VGGEKGTGGGEKKKGVSVFRKIHVDAYGRKNMTGVTERGRDECCNGQRGAEVSGRQAPDDAFKLLNPCDIAVCGEADESKEGSEGRERKEGIFVG